MRNLVVFPKNVRIGRVLRRGCGDFLWLFEFGRFRSSLPPLNGYPPGRAKVEMRELLRCHEAERGFWLEHNEGGREV